MGSSSVSEIDVRTIVPQERHLQIFGRLDAPGQFQWAYLQSGPDLWRVQISKLETARSKAESEDSCCSGGACCG